MLSAAKTYYPQKPRTNLSWIKLVIGTLQLWSQPISATKIVRFRRINSKLNRSRLSNYQQYQTGDRYVTYKVNVASISFHCQCFFQNWTFPKVWSLLNKERTGGQNGPVSNLQLEFLNTECGRTNCKCIWNGFSRKNTQIKVENKLFWRSKIKSWISYQEPKILLNE